MPTQISAYFMQWSYLVGKWNCLIEIKISYVYKNPSASHQKDSSLLFFSESSMKEQDKRRTFPPFGN